MLISSIVRTKGADVFTISAGLTLDAAAKELYRRRVGALVVMTDSGEIGGVFSERDLVREVAKLGPSALQERVADAMSRTVVTVDPNETIDEALSRMTDRRIRHLPVVAGGKLLGVVSIGDLVKAKIAETEAEADAMKTYITAN